MRITEQSWALASSCKSHAHQCTVSQVDIQAEHDQWDIKQPVMSFRIFSKHFQTERQQSLKASDHATKQREGIRPITCYFLMLCSQQSFMLFWEISSKWRLEGVHISEDGYCDARYEGICHFLIIKFTKRFKKI